MEVSDLSLNGLKLIKPRVFRDERGFFMESFKEPLYKNYGITDGFQQDNHSYSAQGCIRGMHFQSTPGQGKLVRVAVGRIYDVAVDIRLGSPTFGKWEGVILDDQQHWQLYVPVGFAHGFCVLSEDAHVLYKVTTPYEAATECGFRWDDPVIKIEWPIKTPIVSKRDQLSPFFEECMEMISRSR